MDGTKSWLTSRGVWGGVISLAAGALGMAGHSMTAADQAQLVDLVVGLISAAGGIIAIIGRIYATKQIGSGAGAK